MPEMQVRRMVVLLLLFSVIACGARAAFGTDGSDTVVFVNGDRVSGVLLWADSKSILLKNRALGELTIHWADIFEVHTQNRRWKMEKEGLESDVYVGFRNATLRSKESVAAMQVDSREIPIPTDGIVLFKDQEHPSAGLTQLMGVKTATPTPGTSFAVSLNAPESVVVGSQSQLVFGGSFRVLHNEPDLCAAPSWFSALLLSANHNRTYKVDTAAIVTDTFDGTLSLSNGISSERKLAAYVVGDLFGNSSLGIGLQQSYGAGINAVLFSNGCRGTTALLPKHYRLTLNGDASLRYIHQRLYAPGNPADLAGLRVAEDVDFDFLKSGTQDVRFTINQSMWVIPMLNQPQAIEAGGSLGIFVPLGKSLSVGVTEEDEFFNDAPKAKRKNYSKSALTATLTFPPQPK